LVQNHVGPSNVIMMPGSTHLGTNPEIYGTLPLIKDILHT